VEGQADYTHKLIPTILKKQGVHNRCKPLVLEMAGATRLELATSGVTDEPM